MVSSVLTLLLGDLIEDIHGNHGQFIGHGVEKFFLFVRVVRIRDAGRGEREHLRQPQYPAEDVDTARNGIYYFCRHGGRSRSDDGRLRQQKRAWSGTNGAGR